MPSSCCSGKPCAKPKLRFQYGKNKRGQWYWHIRAKNGEIVAAGEGYKRVQKALNLFAMLRDGAAAMTIKNLSPDLIVK